jgi:hypothetical protein
VNSQLLLVVVFPAQKRLPGMVRPSTIAVVATEYPGSFDMPRVTPLHDCNRTRVTLGKQQQQKYSIAFSILKTNILAFQ